jgi:NADH:ubiquinone reductase (H+-translocating)
MMPNMPLHHVVIIGGGFGGLYAAKALRHGPLRVTLVDKRNFHLFQPLLYQVATGGVSPGDIAHPLRSVFARDRHISVVMAEVIDINVSRRTVILRDGSLTYDTLVLATGASHQYFGHDEWEPYAPGLKTIEDALEVRRRVFLAFEAAERELDPLKRQALMTFVVVGGGPTGVELAGTLGELAHTTLKGYFRAIDPARVTILLLEGQERVLPVFPADLSAKAEAALRHLGVTVRTRTQVTAIDNGTVTMRHGDVTDSIQAHTILWTAGVKASSLGAALAKHTRVELDRAGRVTVEPDLTVPGHPEIFVIGDLATFLHQDGRPLPGLAAVAIQQGRYVGEVIKQRLQGQTPANFRYRHKGSLAIIGRHAGVADLGRLHLGGVPAWLLWLFVHILYLVGFDNKLLVLFQWAWNYFTRKRGAQLITGKDPFPLVEAETLMVEAGGKTSERG